ncbi:DNA repair protein RecN [Clostridia bacterium]|nr:DNA repair protein RecN [Clostridia bacterium]
MLKSLLIKNIALISSVQIDFARGLNVLSGETGAGKSIVIDSINLILGGRADKSLLRHGENAAYVEAVFDLDTEEARLALKELTGEEDETAVVSRTLDADGKSDARINGRAAALSMLRRFCSVLVDLHGQHEHQSLLKVSEHLRILDQFAPETAPLKTALSAELKALHKIEADLNSFGEDGEDRARRLDVLKFQIDEIEGAGLYEGEEEELKGRRELIVNQERILSGLSTANGLLSDENAEGVSASDALNRAAAALESVAEYSLEIEEYAEKLRTACDLADEALQGAAACAEGLDYSEKDADALEARLELIRNFKRKYGGSLDKINQFLEKARAEYDRISGGDAEIARLNKQKREVAGRARAVCGSLRVLREKAAVELETKIASELSDLSMKAHFKVVFNETVETPRFTADGFDTAEFLLSPNPGEPLKPLAKIISGGELSRFMLALKNIGAGAENTPTMIFDEIDTGISGRVGQAVACKMARIAKSRQVVCVTHMPQIAAMADRSFLISKSEQEEKTLTAVNTLDRTGFIAEIGRLTGGGGISVHAEKQAADMAEWAQKFKAAL